MGVSKCRDITTITSTNNNKLTEVMTVNDTETIKIIVYFIAYFQKYKHFTLM